METVILTAEARGQEFDVTAWVTPMDGNCLVEFGDVVRGGLKMDFADWVAEFEVSETEVEHLKDQAEEQVCDAIRHRRICIEEGRADGEVLV